MRESEIWKNASDAEFDNALEGMEKLVMNQLYQLSVLHPFSYPFLTLRYIAPSHPQWRKPFHGVK
jgi:hypothetical protein